MIDPRRTFRVLLLAAPLLLVAHFVEEAPGFVAWFNSHAARGITQPLFWSVNYTALAITFTVVILEWFSGTQLSAAVVIVWLSCLMAANAVVHMVAAVVDRGYVPGLVTAILLYVPFYALVVTRVVRLQRLSRGTVVVAAMIGAFPMLLHGYLILFRGSRLF